MTNVPILKPNGTPGIYRQMIFMTLFLFGSAFAENADTSKDSPSEQQQPTASEAREQSWLVSFGSTFLFGPKSNYDSTINVGNQGTAISSSSKGKNSYGLVAGLEYLTGKRFGLAGEISYHPYQYQDGSAADTHIALTAVPKLRFSGNRNSGFWCGLGLGYMNMRIGDGVSGTSAGFTASIPSRNLSAFYWSPRIGGEVMLGDGALGIQLAYNSMSASTPYKLVNSTTLVEAASGDIDIQREWWSLTASYAWPIDF
jgi:hypothetical protein